MKTTQKEMTNKDFELFKEHIFNNCYFMAGIEKGKADERKRILEIITEYIKHSENCEICDNYKMLINKVKNGK